MPAEKEGATCHRVRYLTRPLRAARSSFITQTARDDTNFDTIVEPCRQPLAESQVELIEWVERLAAIDGVQRRDQPDGSISLAVRGLEFARGGRKPDVWSRTEAFGDP